MTNRPNESIIKQKEDLASMALQVAEDSLGLLKDQLESCPARELVTIFSSAVRVHREIVADILSLTENESKSEKELAREYDGRVGELLKSLKGRNNQQG